MTARKRAAGIAASDPTAPEPTGTLEGAPGADSEALAARDAATHVMRWTYEGDRVVTKAVCLAASDANCRLAAIDPHCYCEWWGRIERRDDGTIWHLLAELDGKGYIPQPSDWHQVAPQDDCNICLFINESGCAEELTPDGEHHEFAIADIPFEPVWENDGCSWRPITGLASSWLADHDRQIAERALAEAWDEGYDARGVDITKEGLTHQSLTPNPYRAARQEQDRG